MGRLNYILRVGAKVLSFTVFGIGSLMIGAGVFPFILLFVRKPGRASELMRGIISRSFRGFIGLMKVLRLITITWTGDLEELRNAGGRIIIANHPSLLDIVFIISQVDRADCIVKGSLFRFPFVRHTVMKLYIPNDLTGQDMIEACRRSLEEGNTLIVFPEGTRTRGRHMNPMKRGAARLSLQTGRPCIPVRILTPDATGLRKGDRFLSYCKDGPIKYNFDVGKPVLPEKFRKNGDAADSRTLTEAYRSILEDTSLNRV